MSEGKEQEQLLADASTLLMFASAAARQGSPPQTRVPSGSLTVTESANFNRHSASQILKETEKPQGGSEEVSEAGISQHPSRLHHVNSAAPSYSKPSFSTGPSLLPSVLPSPSIPRPIHGPIQGSIAGSIAGSIQGPIPGSIAGSIQGPIPGPIPGPIQGSIPHLQSLGIVGNPMKTVNSRNGSAGSYQYAPQISHNIQHLPQLSQNQSQNPQRMPFVPFGFYGMDATSGSVPVPFKQTFPGNYSMTNAAQISVPLTRQSIAQSKVPDDQIGKKHNIRETQSASPQEGSSGTSGISRISGASGNTGNSDTKRLSQPENNDNALDDAGSNSILHARGSFTTVPQRRPSASSTTTSPGVNNLPYSRGINVESRKRSSDNAMIAAAALAAAADVPFPLKTNEKTTSDSANGSISDSVSDAKSEKNSARNTATSEINTDDISKGADIADSAATEPEEDDDNKTEEENVSSKPGSFSANIQSPAFPEAESIKSEAQPETEPELVPGSPESSGKGPSRSRGDSKPPPLSSYKVDPDAGIIGCICAIDEDDGFTIQCDLCFRWQHCSCMGYLTNEEVPEDEYKCYYCDEQKWNKIDGDECRAATLARLDMDRASDVPETPQTPEMPVASKRKTSSSGNDEKKRRKSEKDAKPFEKSSSEKRKHSSGTSPDSKALVEFRNKDNPLLEEGVTAEPYQGVYYRLEENDYKTPAVRNQLLEFGARSEKSGKSSRTVETMSHHQFKQTKLSKISLPHHQKYLHNRNEIKRDKGVNKTSIKVQVYSENPKQKFVSVMKFGLFISQPSSNSGEVVIPAGTPVIEFLGEVDLFKSHVGNKANQYMTWGTVKPRVVKITLENSKEDRLDLVVDSRFVGNEARFIRRSCVTTANCEIRPVYISQQSAYKFLVVTSQPIVLKGDKSDEELRLPWEWDPSHPINEMIQMSEEGTYQEGKRFEDFSDEEKTYLISCVDTMLNFVECACNTTNTNNQCAIFKVKKATSYLLRSNRKASSLGGTVPIRCKEELVMPKKTREYVSWKQRLEDRDRHLLAKSEYASTLLPHEVDEFQEQKEPETSTPDGESIADTSILEEVNTPKPRQYKSTFRKEFLARKNHVSLPRYEVVSSGSTIVDPSTIALDMPHKLLAVPLTSEVLAKIKRQVNEAFMPLQKTASVALMEDVKATVPEVIKDKIVVPSDAPSPVAKPAAAIITTDAKPVAKKKLSFADYKKKMK